MKQGRRKPQAKKKKKGKGVSKEKEKKLCGLEEKKCGKGEICCMPYSQGLLREFLGLFQKATEETNSSFFISQAPLNISSIARS